jgi:hypothetical protein
LKVKSRDAWLGWSAEQRMAGLRRLANNTRFCVLPWVRVPHLASHLGSAQAEAALFICLLPNRALDHPPPVGSDHTPATTGTARQAAEVSELGRRLRPQPLAY